MSYKHLTSLTLCLSFLFFAACGEEKDFMTPKKGEIVIDIKVDEYLLNGKVIGKTVTDISNIDDLLIKPLYNKLEQLRNQSRPRIEKAKLHLDDNLSFDVCYKLFATMGIYGLPFIQYVLGSDFTEMYTLHLPERNPDQGPLALLKLEKELSLLKADEKNLSDDKISQLVIKDLIKEKQRQIERLKNKINLSLSVTIGDEGCSYVVGMPGGFHTFTDDMEMWKFLEELRLKPEFQDKEDRDRIILVLEKSVLLKNVAPIIKKLNDYGYMIHLALSAR